tara:strand:- start:1123 stop:1443 length:321 start_codon:yes stop_codon:yes gene_type:complete
LSCKSKDFHQSRWEFLKKANEDPDFPEIGSGLYLTEWLFSVGPVMRVGDNHGGVSNAEIAAWASNGGLRFEGPDGLWLFEMSRAYSDELHRSSDKDTEAPFMKETD